MLLIVGNAGGGSGVIFELNRPHNLLRKARLVHD